MLITLAGAWAAVVANTAMPAELTPNDFAYGAKVTAPSDAAAYRVSLPLTVYQNVANEDVSDLSVFNARGERVPYRIERPRSQSATQAASVPLPVFPVQGSSQEALDATRVIIESSPPRTSDRSASAVFYAIRKETRVGAGDDGITRYILDGRALEAPVAALEVSWPEDAPTFAGRLRVESSDDLDIWRTVAEGAPIANLRAGDARIIEKRVDVRGTSAKYWRLSWRETKPPFDITDVKAEPAEGHVDVTRATLAAEGKPVAGKQGEFEFDLGAKVPIDRVNLELPEQNSIVEVELLSRADLLDPWRPVINGGFYRLKSATGADLQNGSYLIGLRSHRYWLARVDMQGGGVGQGALKLNVGWLPHDVVFLARGTGPFTVAYGNRKMAEGSGSGGLGAIPESVSIVPAHLDPPQTLGGEERLGKERTRRALVSKSAVLWSVLAIGVALLAFMAYRLSRELK